MSRIAAVLASAALLASVAWSVPQVARAEETIFMSPSARAAADQNAAIVAARQLIASGDLNAAVTQLARWVTSHPHAADAARFLGDLYYRQGKFDQAEAIYRQILAQYPKDKETHNRLGVVYAAQNRIDEAIVEFDNALPGTDSIRDLVLAHLRKGDLPAYEAQMLREATENPSDSDIQEEVGEIYEAVHQPTAAVMYFRKALDGDPNSIPAINGIGMSYLDMHDYQNAERYLNECLERDPANYACLDNLGAAYLETGRYAQAAGIISHAHNLAPERPEAIVNFGYLADAKGNWKRAVAYYVQAVSVDPYVPESYVNLGIDYEHHGLYPLAQAALLRGIAAAPYDGRIRYLLGRAYAAQGETTLALAQMRAAETSFDPDIAHIAREESAQLLNAPAATPQ